MTSTRLAPLVTARQRYTRNLLSLVAAEPAGGPVGLRLGFPMGMRNVSLAIASLLRLRLLTASLLNVSMLKLRLLMGVVGVLKISLLKLRLIGGLRPTDQPEYAGQFKPHKWQPET